MEKVSWYDAQAFIDSLNKLTGRHFRLPTEAEWQHAAWGERPRLKYSGSDTIMPVAWDIHQGFTHLVGSKRPNGYCLTLKKVDTKVNKNEKYNKTEKAETSQAPK